jgi:purine nucleosidase/pyrimidine-specific ribonucleoside hydrolase
VVKTRRANVEIELNGKFTRGATVVDIYNRNGSPANVDVAIELDFDRFWSLILDAVEVAAKA